MIVDYAKILQAPEIQEKLFDSGTHNICLKYAPDFHINLDMINSHHSEVLFHADKNLPESGVNYFSGEFNILQFSDDAGNEVKWVKVIGVNRYEFESKY